MKWTTLSILAGLVLAASGAQAADLKVGDHASVNGSACTITAVEAETVTCLGDDGVFTVVPAAVSAATPSSISKS